MSPDNTNCPESYDRTSVSSPYANVLRQTKRLGYGGGVWVTEVRVSAGFDHMNDDRQLTPSFIKTMALWMDYSRERVLWTISDSEDNESPNIQRTVFESCWEHSRIHWRVMSSRAGRRQYGRNIELR